MDNWKPQLSLIGIFLLLTACTTLQVTDRQPSTQEDAFSAFQRSRFYLSLMPKDQQVENTIEISDFGAFQKSCLQTEYGSWARPMKNSEELDRRYSFLIGKLNRPFYFLFVPSNDSKLHVLGRLDDFREMICVSFVLNDGKAEDNASSSISSEFLKKVLQLPNINSQVLDMGLQLWVKSGRDAKTAQMIITHPLVNQFNLVDIVGAIFHNPLATDTRMSIFATILRSDVYTSYAAELFPFILGESSNFISVEERFLMFRILMSGKNKFDHVALLNFAVRGVDSSKDYSELFQQLSKARPPAEQFEILSKMLNAGANLPSAEKIFLDIWKQSSSSGLKDFMTAFAQGDLSNEKWLSREVIHRITIERLSSPYSIKGIKTTLSNYRRGEESSPEVKLTILRLLGSQQELFDATCTKNFIDAAFDLRRANPAVESEITDAVVVLGTRFKGNDEVLVSYMRYLKNMKNKKIEIDLVQKILPDIRIEERDLIAVAKDAYALRSEDSYSFLEKVISQPQITARGLSELIGMVRPLGYVGFKPNLSASDKKILTLIVGHIRATDQVKEEANKFLNPVVKVVEDPSRQKR